MPVILVALIFLAALAAPAADAPSARSIMEEVQHRAYAKNMRYEGHITVVKPGGGRDEKSWKYARFGPPEKAKTMLKFTDPAEIRGVALLTWNLPDKPANVWLYTPATARHRRIPRQNRTSRFAGTDFTYEDLGAQDTNRWVYTDLLDNVQQGGEPCWRLKARRVSPPSPASEYTLIWVSKEKLTPRRTDRVRDGKVIRSLRMSQLGLHQGIWTPMVVEVSDHVRNSTTTLRLSGVRYGEPMSAAEFSLEAMKDEW